MQIHFRWQKQTYKNQSMARMSLTSSTGSPTADKTIAMVTRPADGTPAAPMAAAVAVKLLNIKWYGDHGNALYSMFVH